jgi:hypothetical protein
MLLIYNIEKSYKHKLASIILIIKWEQIPQRHKAKNY